MKVLHAAAEVFPLIKTGGLADVLGALPEALSKCGVDVRLVLPGLPAIKAGVSGLRLVCDMGALFGAAKTSLWIADMPGSKLPVYLVEAPFFYKRKGNPYLNAGGEEWTDNLQRFALLGWVAAHLATGELDTAWKPDVLHLHDWHAAMACAYLAANPSTATATVFTVHNLAYQGLFDAADFHLLNLPARVMKPTGLEFHGQLSFMKAGLAYADRISTVSPNYAREIATPDFGCGLEGVIQARGAHVSGILNGVDADVWNPENDSSIGAPYSAKSLVGKGRCKAVLQSQLGLTVDPEAPLLGVVSRLTPQKGLDLVLAALPRLLAEGAQLAVQGNGDAALEAAFKAVAAAHPDRVAVRLTYDEAFAHQMIAGADMLLVPSRFEPCGLTQLYALRYGTLPVVREVGGLADTVVHTSLETLAQGTATGFVFGPATSDALANAVADGVRIFRQPKVWQKVMRQAMGQSFSWDAAASQYLALYREAHNERTSAWELAG